MLCVDLLQGFFAVLCYIKNMQEQFSRTALLIGEKGIEKLAQSHVAVFGIGGVGGYAAEALVRSGIGAIDLIDSDKFCLSNLNRQIYALRSTVGKFKVDVAKERILDINPDVKVNTFKTFFNSETSSQFDFSSYDYIVDAIDTVSGKIELILCSENAGVPIISSMGAGNKMKPEMFEIADIFKTSVCPLAKVMRQELRNRNIKKLKVVYSKEPPLKPDYENQKNFPSAEEKSCCTENVVKRSAPGSNAFVPAVAGLIIAGEVVKDLIGY